jgi:hypothetical protein
VARVACDIGGVPGRDRAGDNERVRAAVAALGRRGRTTRIPDAVRSQVFARYGLTLHPEKTRLIAFRRPSGTDRDVTARPTSFDMLGFTHVWTRSRRGSWVITRKTARDRFSRALRAIAQWCRQYRHTPVSWQHAVLSRKLRGHCSYYGITGNSVAITRFRREVRSRWRKWLDRRGGRSLMSWLHFHRLEERYPLPAAIAVHSSYRRAANP